MNRRQSIEYREGGIGGNDQEAFATTVQVGSDKDLIKSNGSRKDEEGKIPNISAVDSTGL